MAERRFNEAEVAAIFEMAAEAQHTGQRQLPSGEGLTVAELQAIGKEVGIAPELIVQAAQRMEVNPGPAAPTFLGLPVRVARTVDLGRTLSDEEWERLVVDLRETFDAKGVVKRDGSLRQWTNGNLQALLEPTGRGHRLRLRTMKGDARGLMIGGLAMFGVAAVGFISAALGGGVLDPEKLSSLAFVGAGGVGMFGFGAIRLPGWARLRRRQMDEIADRLKAGEDSIPEV